MADNQSIRQLLERELFPYVEKPVRYIGNELNCIKKELRQVALHGVLCFPELYDIGMSHFGSQILYHIVNRHEPWALSRCYHPWLDAERILREKKIPLYSLEYFTPLSSADWLGFSVQYELQYTNLVNMLDLAGIARNGNERTDNDPIVIAGGPCMGNPEPIAGFIDAGVIGDGEDAVVSVCETLERLKKAKAPRKERLEALSAIDGVYVPQLYPLEKRGLFFIASAAGKPDTIRAAKVPRLSDGHYSEKQLVPLAETVHARFTVEVMRGCTRGCRFCSAGFYYRPLRERGVDSIAHEIEHGLQSTGLEDVGLLSLSTADYSCFGGLIRTLGDLRSTRHMRVALPSTRVDALSEDMLKELHSLSPATSFTIAPEAGSQRLRCVINKDFTEESILQTVAVLLQYNIQTLKLYFMIGLPTETDDDITAIISLVSKISGIVRAKSKRREVNVSISPFSPKPHTPFQWEAMETSDLLLEKGRRIKNELRVKRNVTVSYRDPGMTLLETVFARGDRSLGAVISKAWEKGARFDGWDDQFKFSLWQEAAAEAGISFDPFIKEIPLEQTLPWSIIDIGLKHEFLVGERNRSREAKSTGDCRKEMCTGCGICDRYKKCIIEKSDGFTENVVRDGKKQESVPEKRFYFRIEYAKGYEVRFVSHRNLADIFIRAFCMAAIPVGYSQGFHPHPTVAFGPPLPVGVIGDAEFFDVAVTRDGAIDYHLLNRHLPDGLVIKKCYTRMEKTQSLFEQIVAARYAFVPLLPISGTILAGAVEKAGSALSLPVTVRRKEKQVELDIKPLIYDIRRRDYGATPGFEATVSLLPSKTCRPDDLLACLFPEYRFGDFLVTRTECLKSSKGKFIKV